MSENSKKNSKWFVIVLSIICIILLPILIVNMTLIVKSYLSKDVPDIFGYKPFIVLSGSMETEIYKNDLVIVKEVDPKTLKEGDIIAFLDGDMIVTHRIKAIESHIDPVTQETKSYFITRGDNNDTDDMYPVYFDAVEGVFVKRIPNLGGLALFLQSPWGIIIIIGIPVLGWIVYDLILQKKKTVAKETEKSELEAEIARLKAEKELLKQNDTK